MSRRQQKITEKYPPNTNTRIVAFGFRASPAEAEEINKKARLRGLSSGEYCRIAALEQSMPNIVPPALSDIDREAIYELKKIGVNLNQSVTALNVANRKGEMASHLVVSEIHNAAQLIRRAVFRLLKNEIIDDERDINTDHFPVDVDTILDAEDRGDIPSQDTTDLGDKQPEKPRIRVL